MKVVFRVDASLEIGTGHVMRCLTLADELRQRGAGCHFVCRAHPGHLAEKIRESVFGVSVLQGDHVSFHACTDEEGGSKPLHADWLGCDWSVDAIQTAEVLKKHQPDWLIVDHYAIDHQWEQEQRYLTKKTMVIDDLADRTHECDVLLDQNIGKSFEDYADLTPVDCKIMAGPEFALIRPEFALAREESLKRRSSPGLQRILISLGGVDRDNVTGQILNVLGSWRGSPGIECVVILGSNAPFLSTVRKELENFPHPAELLVESNKVAAELSRADLAIGAAGISSWERCCLGVPSLVCVLAENQKISALRLSNTGAAMPISIGELLQRDLHSCLDSILEMPWRLVNMSTAAAEITDGQGVKHVADLLIKSGC